MTVLLRYLCSYRRSQCVETLPGWSIADTRQSPMLRVRLRCSTGLVDLTAAFYRSAVRTVQSRPSSADTSACSVHLGSMSFAVRYQIDYLKDDIKVSSR